MTHREHFLRLMAGQTTDWIPNYELGAWGQTRQRWIDEGMPEDQANANMWSGVPALQIDGRRFLGLNIRMIPGFEHQVIEEDEHTILFRDATGILRRGMKEGMVRGTRLSMDTYIEHPVKDRASWEDVKRRYNASAPERYPANWLDQFAAGEPHDEPACLLGNGSFGLYSQLRSWVGTESLSLMFYDEPALVEEMIELNTDFLLELVEPALQQGQFDYFNFFEDCAGKGGPLFGPELFRKFFMRHYKRIIERLNGAGIHSIWVDCDGDPEVLVPLWMEAGVNCFWPLEQASGMDPRRLRKKFGNDLVLAGGLDKMELAKGREAIDRELYAKIPPLLESGGYIPHIDHAVSPEISYDGFRYYLELKRKLTGHE